MENTNILEPLLWVLAILVASGMVGVLALGWWKGNAWQREMKNRHADRY